MRYRFVDSRLGPVLVAADEQGLREVSFQEGVNPAMLRAGWVEDQDFLEEPARQLQSYLAGSLRRFDLRLAPRGTPFQQKVWRALEEIPYGRTITYSELAQSIGRPAACRAVGAANGRNPLPIVLPCHRVIGSNGTLTGYGAGLKFKEALLQLERQKESGIRKQEVSRRGAEMQRR
ncbi:MAG: methylated-DNA--[protein]-cysteine S-methyltransferase [Acidobacteriota bacterium]